MSKVFKNFQQLKSKRPQYPQDNSAYNLILNRSSCRNFTDEPVPNELIIKLLEAGRYAPSAVNMQSWTFITFTPQQWQDAIGTNIPWKAPLAIMICADLYRLAMQLPNLNIPPKLGLMMATINASIAAGQIALAAESLSLGCVMNSDTSKSGIFSFKFLQEKLQLPKKVVPLMTLSIGYPAGEKFGLPPRLPLEAIHGQASYPTDLIEQSQNWLDLMKLGFKIRNPFSSFDKKLEYYSKNFNRIEEEIDSILD
jgi:nitroreductase